MEQIKISVRNLVEFILRSGDIDNRRGRAAQKEAMQEGSKIHRKIQRRMGASYQPEVSLKIELKRQKYIWPRQNVMPILWRCSGSFLKFPCR